MPTGRRSPGPRRRSHAQRPHPHPTLAVKDISAARGFYEGVLALSAQEEDAGGGGVLYGAGSGSVLVYPSEFAGTNRATSAAFSDPDGNVLNIASMG